MKSRLLPTLAAIFLAGCSSPTRWSQWETPAIEPTTIQTDASDQTVEPFAVWKPAELTWHGDALVLSLEEAVFTALERNRDLRIQNLNPIIAGAFEDIERGVYAPELYATVQTGRERASETARATGERFDVTAEDMTHQVGVRQELPTGTLVDLSLDQRGSTSNRTPEQQSARIGLSVTQSLLRGLGPTVNLASVRQAELNTLASKYELRGFTEALVAEVETAYWSFVLAEQQISIFESSLELARLQLEEVEERISVGALSETNGAIARGEVALRQSALIDARADLETQRYRLSRLLNASPSGNMDLRIRATSQPDTQDGPVEDLLDRVELALIKRPDLNEARLRLEQDRLQTVVTRNGLLPRLDLFVNLGKTGYSDAVAESFKNLNDESYDLVAGVRFSHYLGQSAEEARDLAARATRQQSAEALSNHEQIVRLDVRLAAVELERSRQQLTATAAIRRHQEDTVEGEIGRLDVGASTALQVAQAQRDLLESQINEAASRIAYRIALIELHLAEGTLLERRGIAIP